MDTILNIFSSLGVDKSFFTLLAMVIVSYFILKFVLFNKLQYVLELRESKTTKLEAGAHKKFQEAEELAGKYKQGISSTQQEADEYLSEKKNEVLSREKGKISQVAKELENIANEERKKFSEEILERKKGIMEKADALSTQLVDKVTQ
jgi:F-type H+-transporting ATPase subunit b